MSNPEEMEQGQDKLSRITTSRRGFLKLTGLAALTAVGAKVGLGTSEAHAAPQSPLESPLATPDVGEGLTESAPFILPVVFESIKPSNPTGEANIQVNVRPEASTDNTPLITLEPGDTFEILEDNVAPYGDDAHFDLIDTKKVDAKTELVVDTINDQPTYDIITEGQPSVELPKSDPLAVNALTSFYVKVSEGTGGLAQSPAKAQSFMAATGAIDIDFSNPNRALQKMEFDAAEAIQTDFEDGSESKFITLANMEDGKMLKAFVKKGEGDTYDIVSSQIGNGLFTYRSVSVSGDGNVSFSHSSILSFPALVRRYGNEAVTIAQEITAMGEHEAVEVDEETGKYTINKNVDENTASFLEDIVSTRGYHVYLPKLGKFALPVQASAELTGHVHYMPQIDGSYSAVYESVEGQGKEWLFYDSPEAGEWVELPDAQRLQAEINLYAKMTGKEKDEVLNAIKYESKQARDGTPYFAVVHDGTPFLIGQKNTEGEWGWSIAYPGTIGRLKNKPMNVGVTVDGAEKYKNDTYQQTAYEQFSMIAPSGSFDQYTMETWPETTEEFVAQAKEHHLVLRAGTSFFHHTLRAYYEKHPNTDIDEFIDRHIDSVFKFVGAIDGLAGLEISFANEADWFNQEGKVGWENSPLYERYGENWPVETYVRYYTKAVELGLVPGKDVKFIWNNYGTELKDDVPGTTEKVDADVAIIQNVRAKIAQRLGKDVSEIPIEVGMQMHASTDAVAGWLNPYDVINNPQRYSASISRALDALGQIGPVHITEADVHGSLSDEDMATYIGTIVGAASQNEHCASINFWDAIRFDRASQLFTNELRLGSEGYKPNRAYYALLKNLYA